MPLYGTHEQRYMSEIFSNFIEAKNKIVFQKDNEKIIDGINRIANKYFEKYNINQLEEKLNKKNKIVDFLEDCYENECFFVKEGHTIYEEDIYEVILELNELDKLEKSKNEIYHMDSYSFRLENNKYRCWIYKKEIMEYIDIYLFKISGIKKAINFHNINVGVNLALLRKSNIISLVELKTIKSKILEMENKEYSYMELMRKLKFIINTTLKKKKVVSNYNLFVKEKMFELKNIIPNSKERLKKCAELWNEQK